MFDLIDFDFCLSDDALWAKIHLIYFGICTFYIEEKVIKLYLFTGDKQLVRGAEGLGFDSRCVPPLGLLVPLASTKSRYRLPQ